MQQGRVSKKINKCLKTEGLRTVVERLGSVGPKLIHRNEEESPELISEPIVEVLLFHTRV